MVEKSVVLENESVVLTRKLALCSCSCANSIRTLKYKGETANENNVIVFISDDPKAVEDAIKRSLSCNDVALKYIITTIDNYMRNKTQYGNLQIFIVAGSAIQAFLSPNYIVVDLNNDRFPYDIGFCMDILVKNISKYIQFDIEK